MAVTVIPGVSFKSGLNLMCQQLVAAQVLAEFFLGQVEFSIRSGVKDVCFFQETEGLRLVVASSCQSVEESGRGEPQFILCPGMLGIQGSGLTKNIDHLENSASRHQ